ncbi:hypothetical protein FJZ39_00610 [Candidatus Saccharibacteria bacterium]|nr:hypothetical protein [Candidatus Saccharibacteria bacterium]
MKLATKTIASLYSTIASALKPGVELHKTTWQRCKKIIHKHDRKAELRASLLGVKPEDFREQERKGRLANYLEKFGFKNEQSFYVALLGKLRHELRQRGWSAHKIAAIA